MRARLAGPVRQQNLKHLDTLDMGKITDLKAWVQHTDEIVRQHRHTPKARHTRTTQTAAPMKLWELDICDFFPSMDREPTLQAMKDIHDLEV